jgi:pimeloyl-ACP methyl ester carboxylesterase
MRSGYVTTEGDNLYYEVRGRGPPLLMISGAGGDAWWYSFVADRLADEFTVITYDRRGNAKSTRNYPQNFEVSQQSRDAVAVLNDAGEESGFVFGNSSGAVIALDMAKTQPRAVKAVVAHEPPLARVHPNADRWQRFYADVYRTSFRFGVTLAMLRFLFGVGLPKRKVLSAARTARALKDESDVQTREELLETYEFFLKRELLPVTNYVPDIGVIAEYEIPVSVGAGELSLQRGYFYAETAVVLAEKFGREPAVFPGHHFSYMDRPNAWAKTLRNILFTSCNLP